MFEFSYKEVPEWPMLAWLAICNHGSSMIRVHHGSSVEIQPDWFCEAVWDSDFKTGNFDKTDAVFGTGGRVRTDGIHFVSSGSTVDRLNVITGNEQTFVSNSLPCVLEAADASLDPAFRGYMNLFSSISSGLKTHVPELPLAKGCVRLVYFTNLIWDGEKLLNSVKPAPEHSLDNFDDYVLWIHQVLERIGNNLAAPGRSTQYTWMGTLSRGYDSPACVALAKHAGMQRVLTFNESRPGIADDGQDIAGSLKVECLTLDRLGWHGNDLIEPAFLVADAQGKEISMAAAGDTLKHTVLVTGHGGDYTWSREPHPVGENLQRGCYSGLSMTEYRLHQGFIHFPIPFLGMRRVDEIARISRSDTMKQWDRRGSYSRPICRRLVEETGVASEQFGISKTGNSVRFLIGQDAWSKTGKRAYLKWLSENREQAGLSRLGWIKVRSIEIILHLTLKRRDRPQGALSRTLHRIHRKLAARVRRYGLEDMPFVWAVETIRMKYKRQ